MPSSTTVAAVEPLTDAQVRETEVYGILTQQASLTDITVSIGKELWLGEKDLPDTVHGVINQWINKANVQIKITWTEADGTRRRMTLMTSTSCCCRTSSSSC